VGPAYIMGDGNIAMTVLSGSKTPSSSSAWCCLILHGNGTSSSFVHPPVEVEEINPMIDRRVFDISIILLTSCCLRYQYSKKNNIYQYYLKTDMNLKSEQVWIIIMLRGLRTKQCVTCLHSIVYKIHSVHYSQLTASSDEEIASMDNKQTSYNRQTTHN